MKPPLNHMMLHADALADEFDAILNYRASHEGLVLAGWPDDDAKALVFDGAGVADGVTPGLRNLAGTGDPVVNTDYSTTGATLTQWRDKMVVNSLADMEAYDTANAFISKTGTGTTLDPYIFTITTRNWERPNNPGAVDGSHLVWTDTAAAMGTTGVYHIRVYDCLINMSGGAQDMFNIDCGASGKLIVERCSIRNTSVGSTTVRNFLCTSGTVQVTRSVFTNINGRPFYKVGASAVMVCDNCIFDTSINTWGVQPMFWNTVAGGSITIDRCTFDHRNLGFLLHMERDCAVTVDRMLWNSSDSANTGLFIPTSTGYLSEKWSSGLTMTDSRAYAGSAAVSLIGHKDLSGTEAVANWSITHCDFIASTGRMDTAFMVGLGKSGSTDGTDTHDITFSWCRFTRPNTQIIAGNEIFYIIKAARLVYEYCWVDACGEDAYEMSQPYDGCEIRYCGGTDVGGNMVDFYGAGGLWTGSTNCSAHHIWGATGGDAVIVDSCVNVAVHHIDVDNVAGGFVQNPPASNVRLHSRGAGALNGVTVTVPLSDPDESFNGKPCELTYESGTHDAGTVVWPEWNGTSFDIRGGTDGIVDGM